MIYFFKLIRIFSKRNSVEIPINSIIAGINLAIRIPATIIQSMFSLHFLFSIRRLNRFHNSTFVPFYALILLALAVPSFAQVPVAVGPGPKTQFLDNTGVPLSGGIVCTYAAGTSTPQATYTDNTGTVQNSNPVVLDSGGRANIWWIGSAYKVVLAGGGTCASPSNLIWTVDGFSIGVFASGNNSFSGNDSFSGTSTFTGAVTITNGGTFNGTFAGNPTFSGTVTFSGTLSVSQLSLTVATGTPPLIVTSTTVVPNLNVEVVNGVAFPAGPSLHSVPVITTTNTASWKVVPDCQGGVGALNFTQSTNAFSCNPATPGATTCSVSIDPGYALNFASSTWTCAEIIPPVFKKGTGGGDYSSSSGSFVDVDGTNLAYTVTIPTGSNLVVQASGQIDAPAIGTSVTTSVAISDGGTPVNQILMQDSNGDPSQTPYSIVWVIAGDGNSHAITLQYKKGGGSASSAIITNSSGIVPTMLFTMQ